MPKNQAAGDQGEKDVINRVACPNCGKKLMALPRGYPMFDVQCTACVFRAQVKTASSKPKDVVYGAGWDILSKALKAGQVVPPLIVNFKWKEGRFNRQAIYFYPFIPKENLKSYRLAPTAKQAGYAMFNYIGLTDLPHFVLYPKSKAKVTTKAKES